MDSSPVGNAAVGFRGTPTQKQFEDVQAALTPSWARWYVFVPAVIILTGGTGGAWQLAPMHPARSVPYLLLPVGLLIAQWAITKFSRKKAWREYTRLHGEVSGTVGPDGIKLETQTSSSAFDWSKIIRSRIVGDIALFYYSARSAVFVPRTYVESAEAWRALESIVKLRGERIQP